MPDILNRNNDYKKRPLQRIGIVDKTSDTDQGALLYRLWGLSICSSIEAFLLGPSLNIGLAQFVT